MKIIEPSFEILTPLKGLLQVLELAGRTCYKSEDKITEDSAGPFVSKICQVYKHESVIEHAGFSVKFICDRGVSHELVRHRIASFSQESTRYVNYSKGKFGSEITVIRPFFFNDKEEVAASRYAQWETSCLQAEKSYLALISLGASPQEARSVLPNSLKTEVVMTANLREWKLIFKLRTAENAHPQMRQIMIPLFEQVKAEIPEIFGA